VPNDEKLEVKQKSSVRGIDEKDTKTGSNKRKFEKRGDPRKGTPKLVIGRNESGVGVRREKDTTIGSNKRKCERRRDPRIGTPKLAASKSPKHLSPGTPHIKKNTPKKSSKTKSPVPQTQTNPSSHSKKRDAVVRDKFCKGLSAKSKENTASTPERSAILSSWEEDDCVFATAAQDVGMDYRGSFLLVPRSNSALIKVTQLTAVEVRDPAAWAVVVRYEPACITSSTSRQTDCKEAISSVGRYCLEYHDGTEVHMSFQELVAQLEAQNYLGATFVQVKITR
jgi:hypothetical protein